MKKQLIRLTESDLHRIVKEAVNTILNEEDFHDEESEIMDGWRKAREEREFYNEFGNQSQYPANEFMPPFEGELSMTAQYSPEDYERRMSDWDPEYFLDGKDEIYKSKLPGDYRTKK